MLKYYVIKPRYPKTYFVPISHGKHKFKPVDRVILDFAYEFKPIVVNGLHFRPNQVYAEPAKRTVIFEMALGFILHIAILYFVSPGACFDYGAVCGTVGIIIGGLIGFLRMEKQKKAALHFNLSTYNE